MNELQREEGFSGSVLISEKGRIIYEKSFGFASAENKTPLTENTLFLIGSVAKTFTAVEVFKLNAAQFPKSFNVWDSLGEAYYKNGNLEEAIKSYEKSL